MWLRAQSALHGKAPMTGRILPECTVCLSVLLTYQLLVMLTKSPPVGNLSAGYYTSETGEQNCVVYRALQT